MVETAWYQLIVMKVENRFSAENIVIEKENDY